MSWYADKWHEIRKQLISERSLAERITFLDEEIERLVELRDALIWKLEEGDHS